MKEGCVPVLVVKQSQVLVGKLKKDFYGRQISSS